MSSLGVELPLKRLVYPKPGEQPVAESAVQMFFKHVCYEVTEGGGFVVEILLDPIKGDNISIDVDYEGVPVGAVWSVGQPEEWHVWDLPDLEES